MKLVKIPTKLSTLNFYGPTGIYHVKTLEKNMTHEERQSVKLGRSIVLSMVYLVLFSLFLGCNAVKRRLTITSEPSGALVYLNDREIGRTPISQNFIHSGTYKIRCCKEGFEMEEQYYKAGTPWYLYPGFDFFSENFVPGEIRDEQQCHIVLTPKRTISGDEIRESANRLREEAHTQIPIKKLH